MDQVERMLSECSDQLVDRMVGRAGLSRDEAAAFLRAAAPDLMESYRWQGEAWADTGDHAARARELLSLIPVRKIAPSAGLSSERAWAGLRALVPAVLGGEPGFPPLPSANGSSGTTRGGTRPRRSAPRHASGLEDR